MLYLAGVIIVGAVYFIIKKYDSRMVLIVAGVLMALLAGKKDEAALYEHKADTLKKLVENKLWSVKHGFFETYRTDSLANVREAIGYIPWYFNLPDANKYDLAWKQVTEEGGFPNFVERNLAQIEKQ